MFEAPKIYDMVSPGLEYVHKGLEPFVIEDLEWKHMACVLP